MHLAEDWTIFKDVRTYSTSEMFPQTDITKHVEHLADKEYANVLCRMLNGTAEDVKRNIDVCGSLQVYELDGTLIPVFDCPKQCSVY